MSYMKEMARGPNYYAEPRPETQAAGRQRDAISI